jgi:hypothetical protein
MDTPNNTHSHLSRKEAIELGIYNNPFIIVNGITPLRIQEFVDNTIPLMNDSTLEGKRCARIGGTDPFNPIFAFVVQLETGERYWIAPEQIERFDIYVNRKLHETEELIRMAMGRIHDAIGQDSAHAPKAVELLDKLGNVIVDEWNGDFSYPLGEFSIEMWIHELKALFND